MEGIRECAFSRRSGLDSGVGSGEGDEVAALLLLSPSSSAPFVLSASFVCVVPLVVVVVISARSSLLVTVAVVVGREVVEVVAVEVEVVEEVGSSSLGIPTPFNIVARAAGNWPWPAFVVFAVSCYGSFSTLQVRK